MKNRTIVEEFAQILRNKPLVRTPDEGHGLLSYRFHVSVRNFDRTVNSLIQDHPNAFYFENPAEDVRFLAIGKIISIRSSGNNRFKELSAAYSKIKPMAVHHYNGVSDVPFPLFVGSMSFFPEHRDPMWRNFYPSDWFIPEFILVHFADGCSAAYQTDLNRDTGDEQAILKLKEYLSALSVDRPDVSGRASGYPSLDEAADKSEWTEKVAEIVDSIKKGKVQKVVLSRRVTIGRVESERIVDEILKKGRSPDNCYTFVYKSGSSLFMGISPEKLAGFSGRTVHCNAIAGSIGRGKTGEEDERLGNELLGSGKDRREHEFVIDHIASILNRYCSAVTIDRFPILKKLSYIQHLYTGIRGTLHPGVSMFSVLEDLHPTPAVGGYPRTAAANMIRSMEQYDRGLYTGYLGWFDAAGKGDFCVALRSALLTDSALYAFAGGGIVADSEPEAEYRETEIKLQAITSLLRP